MSTNSKTSKSQNELNKEIIRFIDNVIISELDLNGTGDPNMGYVGRFGPYTTRGNGLARNKGPFKRAASARAR